MILREYCRNSSLVSGSGIGSKTSTSVTFSEIFGHSSFRTFSSLPQISDKASVTCSKYRGGWTSELGKSVDSLKCDSEG